MTFKTKKEAVTLANDSEFGLAAAVFTSDDAQLKRMTKNLRVGFVWNNSSQPSTLPKQTCTYVADKPFAW
ncbi:hypothetical protein JG688_00001387 [Phytophthora aleatoria]|uniref:Aldehyde dehydrogenase domain-containing protein n=1 Tax=Phytophthora aleatoria TaxID=2496075 RepID=A0A8J5IXR8_9STRA|nr:hypothetical protein JG688_00001387 [Phytophthora aleatoria]